MDQLSDIQAQIVKLKSEGLNNRQIGLIVYPGMKQSVADVKVSRELKKNSVAKYIDQGRELSLKKYNISFDRVMHKLNYMLDKTKLNTFTGEVEDDIQAQTFAINKLLPMLDKPPEKPNNITNNIALIKALNTSDPVKLQDAFFSNKTANDE
jgi:hypothetical protein